MQATKYLTVTRDPSAADWRWAPSGYLSSWSSLQFCGAGAEQAVNTHLGLSELGLAAGDTPAAVMVTFVEPALCYDAGISICSSYDNPSGAVAHATSQNLGESHEMPPIAGGSEAVRPCNKSRKVPVANDQYSVDIIRRAREAFSQNCQDAYIWKLASHDKQGSVNLQRALEVAANTGYYQDSWDDAWALLWNLLGYVKQACENPFANYVISQAFQVLPTFIVNYLAAELQQGVGFEVAKNRFGCRCMIRLIRYHTSSAEDGSCVSRVIDELSEAYAKLRGTQFGTHVAKELDASIPAHKKHEMIAEPSISPCHSKTKKKHQHFTMSFQ
jgi:hypothetical protein